VSAQLTYAIDADDLRTRIVGTQRVVALGTRRATQLALEAGAVHARSEHPHKTRTGRLTSPQELRGELRQADETGAWGYLINYTPYGAYVEYGTKAHKIYPKAAGGVLRFAVGGSIVFARYVSHPGTPPLPFMQPAADYAGQVLVRETETTTFALVAQLWD
jgi:hypothetical protein